MKVVVINQNNFTQFFKITKRLFMPVQQTLELKLSISLS